MEGKTRSSLFLRRGEARRAARHEFSTESVRRSAELEVAALSLSPSECGTRFTTDRSRQSIFDKVWRREIERDWRGKREKGQ